MRELSRNENWAVAIVCVAVMWCLGCQSDDTARRIDQTCAEIEQTLDLTDRIETLNRLSAASAARCDEVVATYGAQAREQFRHKTFSITGETMNVFVPDGTFLEYVLESYERGYLSILLATSYVRLQKFQEAKVELRDLDHELFAPIYNFGEDPVNLLLSAVLWERLGDGGEARVDWLRLRDFKMFVMRDDPVLRRFAGERVIEIDEGQKAGEEWHIFTVGTFPGLDWDLRFTNSTSGYFSITPKQKFPASCSSKSGVLISTETWFNKIAIRHSHAYHPILNVQTWIRLPVGLVYSLIPVTAGAGLMVGGCALDVAGEGKGGLCQLSVVGGMALIGTAPRVLEGALRPDLRHWEEVPAAVVVTRAAESKQEPCLANVTAAVKRML
ncbi:hypothetical protein [Petrachloros mirabilis]